MDSQGIQATKKEMNQPENVSELRRFLGMVNQMGKFIINLSELTQPLRELLKKNMKWQWNIPQEEAFIKIKEELCKSTVLSFYDPNLSTKVSADASSYGLGAVLLQQHNSQWKPVAYASHSMSETEKRYSQIEKEALAVTWACDKFANYISGIHIIIETDHKPLLSLLNTKHLEDLPPRVMRFRLRLARFSYSVVHSPGKLMYTADTLSRAPRSIVDNDQTLEEETECIMEVTVNSLPATQKRLQEYGKAQVSDSVCSTIVKYCQIGWPDKHKIEPHLKVFWKNRGEFMANQGLLLYGRRIVVPSLQKIHDGHQGIVRCRLRARSSVWWPGIMTHIKDLVEKCSICALKRKPPQEQLLPSQLPNYPWQKVASDIFYLKNETYIIVTDYFSRYPEVIKIRSTTSSNIIEARKEVFSRHGIPDFFVSDNGPQYSSLEFRQFC